MSESKEKTPLPPNSARGQTGGNTTPVPPAGSTRACTPQNDNYLHRTMPSRQKAAKAFLQGKAPGVQQSYAPNAETSSVEGWVEDDETVERLARWRRDAPYG